MQSMAKHHGPKPIRENSRAYCQDDNKITDTN